MDLVEIPECGSWIIITHYSDKLTWVATLFGVLS